MKSWQIFLIIFVLPFLIKSVIPFNFLDDLNSDLMLKLNSMLIILPILVIFYSLWLLGVGSGLNKLVIKEIRINDTFFIFSLIFLPLYIIFFIIMIYQMILNHTTLSMLILFPLHFFAFFCQLYGFYFISRNILMLEKNRIIKFSEMIELLLLFILLPIGIWYIQPRVNQLYEEKNT